MACLDTSFLIDVIQGRQEAAPVKDDLDRTESLLAIPAPALMKLWVGALLSGRERERSIVISLSQSFPVLPFDARCAREAGEIEHDLTKAGTIVETEDIMIAAITRIHGEKLVTRDRHFSRIPGLKLYLY